MLVSRKNLSLIHLFACVGSLRVDVLETLHNCTKSLNIASSSGIGGKPFTEGGVESGVFGLGDGPGFFDEVGVGA